MLKYNKFAYANLVQLQVDVLFLSMTYCLAFYTANELTSLQPITEYLWIPIFFIPLWISIMLFMGMYDKTTFYYLDRVFRSVFVATFFAGLGLEAMLFFIQEISANPFFIGIFLSFCMSIMFLERYIFGRVYTNNSSIKHAPRIIMVCSRQTYFPFRRYLANTQIRYNIIGIIQVGRGEAIQDELNVGTLEDLEDILINHIIDEVIFALPKECQGEEDQYLHLCEKMGITAHLILNIQDFQLSHVQISMLGPLPVLSFSTVNLNPFNIAAKRLMDIVGALIGIGFALVATLIIAPAIKLDSKGPVFFQQKRVGRYGREFNIYKFRSMEVDAELQQQQLLAQNEHKDGLMFKVKQDPRVTRVGKFLRKTSLDEVPQFFNVLLGEMSLVGTRPPMLEEVAQYDIEQLRRLSIKPGLTGMWQVSGRSDITKFEEVVALDVYYIDNWSIWLDISIILKTLWQVANRKSAY